MMALGVRVQSPRICRRGVGVRLQEVEGMPAGLSPECLPVRRVPLTPPQTGFPSDHVAQQQNQHSFAPCVLQGARFWFLGKLWVVSCGACGWNCLEVGAPSHGWAVRGYRYLITLEVDL